MRLRGDRAGRYWQAKERNENRVVERIDRHRKFSVGKNVFSKSKRTNVRSFMDRDVRRQCKLEES